MSSLPLISHHLFVSAIGNEETSAPGPKSPLDPQESKALPLELIDYAQEAPVEAARPLRASARLSQAY